MLGWSSYPQLQTESSFTQFHNKLPWRSRQIKAGDCLIFLLLRVLVEVPLTR